MTTAPQSQQALALQIRPLTARASRSRARAAGAMTGQLRELEPYDAADHVTRLYRLAIGLCGSRELAEDLVQETYARVLARPRFVRGDGFSYLARALRNVLINHFRAEARRNEAPAAPEKLDLPDPRPTADPETAALTGALYAAIADLPDSQRQVVAAVDLAGMSYAETAALLGVAVGTVMSRLYRARDRIALALRP
jgi:RNA polymerase sigma-70 factor, ECF subfamily